MLVFKVLTTIIDEIDDLLKGIDVVDKAWRSGLDKLKVSLGECHKAADQVENNLRALLKAVPDGPYDEARKAAKDTIALINQGRNIFELDEDFEPIIVTRKLSDALSDLKDIKKVTGLEKAVPSGLWASIDKFDEAVESADKLRKSLAGRDTGQGLRDEIIKKLKELMNVAKQLRAN